MRWNAFKLISPAIKKTKKRVLPFSFKEWLKLGFVGSLSGVSNFSGNSGGSDSSSSKADFSFEQFHSSTVEVFQKHGGVIGIFLSFFLLLSFLIGYVCSVFSFVFIELLVSKQSKINFSKQSSLGTSLFLFRLVISFICLLLFVLLIFPYAYNFFLGNPIVESVGVGYIIFSILALIISVFFLWFLTLFVKDFVTAYMYSKKMPALPSWKAVWKLVSKNKKESFVYWISRILVSFVSCIVFVIVLLVSVILILLLAALAILLGYIIYLVIGFPLFFIVVGVIFVLAIFVFLILAILAIFGPFVSFIKYFHLLNFEKLAKVKLLK